MVSTYETGYNSNRGFPVFSKKMTCNKIRIMLFIALFFNSLTRGDKACGYIWIITIRAKKTYYVYISSLSI